MATKRGKAWRVLPPYIQVTPFREVPAGRMLAADDAEWLDFATRHKNDAARADVHRTHCKAGLPSVAGIEGLVSHWPGRPECEPYDAPENVVPVEGDVPEYDDPRKGEDTP